MNAENTGHENRIADVLKEERTNGFVKIGREYFNLLPRLVKSAEEDKRALFDVLSLLGIEDGFGLGLKLAGHVGMGDESWFFTYDKRVGIKESLERYGGLTGWMEEQNPFGHILVERSAMGAWQAYLYSIASTQLPLFWHGGYNRRAYILTHDDLRHVSPLAIRGQAPLYGIGQDLSPQVRVSGGVATIVCCYWTEWGGLIRETTEIVFGGDNTIAGIRNVNDEVLYEYDCGICF